MLPSERVGSDEFAVDPHAWVIRACARKNSLRNLRRGVHRRVTREHQRLHSPLQCIEQLFGWGLGGGLHCLSKIFSEWTRLSQRVLEPSPDGPRADWTGFARRMISRLGERLGNAPIRLFI